MFKNRKILSSKLIENGVWLYLLQFFNTILPLLTLPYLTRVLGATVYGSFSFSLNIIGYFQVIVEYGFNLTGSRKIAMAKTKEEIEKIYSAITTCKIVLCFITLLLMVIVASIFKVSETQFISMLILYILVVGTSLQQTWFFQGMQDMKYITIVNIIARTFSLILIFLFVKDPNDLYVYCALYSTTFLINGVISIIIISKKFEVKYKLPSLGIVKNEFKDGWHIFTTSAMSRIFSTFSITILGFTSTDSDVGIFAAIQKVPLIIIMLFAPIGIVTYPYVSKIYNESFSKGIKAVSRICKIVMPFAILIALVLIFYSRDATDLVFGKEYVAYSLLLIPLSVWMLVSIFNNFLGIQILVASGHQKEYSTAFSYSLIALIFLNVGFAFLWGLYGVAVANLLAELILTFILLFKIKKISLRKTIES